MHSEKARCALPDVAVVVCVDSKGSLEEVVDVGTLRANYGSPTPSHEDVKSVIATGGLRTGVLEFTEATSTSLHCAKPFRTTSYHIGNIETLRCLLAPNWPKLRSRYYY